MKILLVSHSDIIGGAARATYRLHKALIKEATVQSNILVRVKKTDDYTVFGPSSKFKKVMNLLRWPIGQYILKLQRTINSNLHSGNWIPSFWSRTINSSDADVVNLHWVAGETMSIYDIGNIKKPVIWTLHDMWSFCGTEHVTSYHKKSRWQEGYSKHNRCVSDSGFDLDRLVWLRKKKAWGKLKGKLHIVSPSSWLADCVKDSMIFDGVPVSIIPNALDTETYKPLCQEFCREILGLSQDKVIILFGAVGGGKDNNKGYDLLLMALRSLSGRVDNSNVMCVVFGQSEPEHADLGLPFETRWVGHIHDDATLALLYNSATVMVVPSRQENLPQTATEAQSCGVPVVAFNASGLPDAVVHNQTGYLANAFDSIDLAYGIELIISDSALRQSFSLAARTRAVRLWAEPVVARKYQELFDSWR